MKAELHHVHARKDLKTNGTVNVVSSLTRIDDEPTVPPFLSVRAYTPTPQYGMNSQSMTLNIAARHNSIGKVRSIQISSFLFDPPVHETRI